MVPAWQEVEILETAVGCTDGPNALIVGVLALKCPLLT
jgi:hypothetical protein